MAKDNLVREFENSLIASRVASRFIESKEFSTPEAEKSETTEEKVAARFIGVKKDSYA